MGQHRGGANRYQAKKKVHSQAIEGAVVEKEQSGATEVEGPVAGLFLG